jgi:cyclin C
LCPDDTALLQVAWRVVNDTYRTDVCLMYPPALIALACLNMSCLIQKRDAKQWFSELSVDMEKVFLDIWFFEGLKILKNKNYLN